MVSLRYEDLRRFSTYTIIELSELEVLSDTDTMTTVTTGFLHRFYGRFAD